MQFSALLLLRWIRLAATLGCALAMAAFSGVPTGFFSNAGCVTGKVVAAENGSANGCGFLYFWDLSESSPARKRLTDKKGHEPIISSSGRLVVWSGQTGLGDTVWACRFEENSPAVLIGRGTRPRWWVDPLTHKTFITYCTVGGGTRAFPDEVGTYRQEIDPATLEKIGDTEEITLDNARGDTVFFATDLCNSSISPSRDPAAENRTMFPNHDHHSIAVRGSGGLGRNFIVGGPAPRNSGWSTHPGFKTFTAADNYGSGPIKVVRINDSRIQQSYTINGNYSRPHLWVQDSSSVQTLELSSTHLDFEYVIGEPAPDVQEILVSAGGALVSGLAVLENVPWLSISILGNTMAHTVLPATLTSAGKETTEVNISADYSKSTSYTVSLKVFEKPVLTSIALSPLATVVQPGDKVQFVAIARDQNGAPLAQQPALSWSIAGGGTISNSGLFFASSRIGGPHTVNVSSGGIEAKAKVTVAATAHIDIKVNCGGPAVQKWLADTYSTGTGFKIGGMHNLSSIYEPAPNDVYQVVKRGEPRYLFPCALVPDGSYLVRLHFSDKEVAVGMRLMKISIEDSIVEELFDPYTEAGGPYRAVVKEYTVVVDDGNGMGINFSNGSGVDAFVSGIEIEEISAKAPSSHISINSPVEGSNFNVGDTMHLQWYADTTLVSEVELKISLDSGVTYHYLVKTSIRAADPFWGDFAWTIPDSIQTSTGPASCVTDRCVIQVADYSGTLVDVSDVFRIGPEGAGKRRSQASTVALPSADGFIVRPDGKGGVQVSVPSWPRHSIEVVGIDGRTIARRKGSGAATYVISDFHATGLYLVNVICGSEKYSRVVLIQK